MEHKLKNSEFLNFQKGNADLFMKAIEIVEIRTYISNESIIRRDETTIEIGDTRASFLINCAIEYYKLQLDCGNCHLNKG